MKRARPFWHRRTPIGAHVCCQHLGAPFARATARRLTGGTPLRLDIRWSASGISMLAHGQDTTVTAVVEHLRDKYHTPMWFRALWWYAKRTVAGWTLAHSAAHKVGDEPLLLGRFC